MDKFIDVPLDNAIKMFNSIFKYVNNEVTLTLLNIETDIMRRGIVEGKVKIALKEYHFLKEQLENGI
ncbi:MAG: hypothetical protein ACYDBX_04680 [Patescibacteria group bacterium]